MLFEITVIFLLFLASGLAVPVAGPAVIVSYFISAFIALLLGVALTVATAASRRGRYCSNARRRISRGPSSRRPTRRTSSTRAARPDRRRAR